MSRHRFFHVILPVLFVLFNLMGSAFAAKTYSDNGDGTVTDPTTGLQWMRCSMGQTWTGTACTGTASTYTFDQANALTGTVTFAGQSDWRVPNIRELQTIVDRTKYAPAINQEVFQNALNSEVWSGSPHVGSSGSAWLIDFNHGSTYGQYRNYSYGVRLVRGGQSFGVLDKARPTTDYVDHGDGTVTHTPTGLMWQHCSYGQTWSGSTCNGTASSLNYDAANALTSSFAGKTDWRLPTVDELFSLVDYTRLTPAINPTIFPATLGSFVWSGSPYVYSLSYAWYVHFNDGQANGGNRYDNSGVRLVRSGQSFGPLALTISKSGVGTVSSTLGNINCGGTCTANFTSGTKAILTATPASGSVFSSWSGACSGTTTSCTVTMDAAKTVTANFTNVPLVANSATSRTFFSLIPGTISTAQTVTLSNGGFAPLSITSIAATGDFAQTNTCGTSVAVGANCTLTITFTPTTSGARTGAISIVNNATGSPHTISLSGTGAALSSLAIIGATNLNEGATGTYGLSATYDNGNAATVTGIATLTGSAAALNGLTLTGGTVTSNQSVTLNASYTEFGVTKTATLPVTITNTANTLTGITINGPVTVNELASGSYSLTASYANNPSATVAGTLALTGSAASLSGGTLTGSIVTADQSVTVNATYTENGVTKTASLPVSISNTANTLTGLTINGPASVNEGGTGAYSLTATYANNPSATVTGALSLSGSAATLSGLTLTGGTVISNQSVTLNATFTEGGVTKTATLPVTVTNTVNALTSIAISGFASIDEGASGSYSLTATYDNGSTANVAGTLTLSGTAATLAGTTLTGGVVTSDQLVTLNASYTEGGVSKATSLAVTIKNAVNMLTSLAISGPASVNEATSGNYSLVATYDNGSAATVSGTLTITGSWATLSGTILNAAAAVTADQTVTLNATYSERGVTKTASFPVTIKDVAPVTSTITVHLEKGWNLIGSGGQQPATASTLFPDKTKVSTVWKWLSDRSQWAFYAPSLDAAALQTYADNKGYKVLSTIEGREGFWVNVLVAHDITVPFGDAYAAVDHRASLLTGWNLVAVGETLTPVRFNNYLTPYSGVVPPAIGSETTTTVYQINLTTLWTWDAVSSNWYFYAPSLHQEASLENYIIKKGYLYFTTANKTLGQGVGFWVNKP